MDLLTQGLVGSAVAQSFCRPKAQYRVAFYGAIAGMAPDLDALIGSSADPLLNLDYHRHFSHSLAFIPLGAFIVALSIWLVSRRRFEFREIWMACLLGYATHGFLDACTSYGTHLWWPFALDRVSWNLVSIIDPLFSLPLLVLTVWGAWRSRVRFPRAAAIFCACYLLFALAQHRQAESAQQTLIAQRDHTSVRQVVKPSIGNVFLHRSVYLHDGVYHADAIHVVPGLTAKIYRGGKVNAFEAAKPSKDVVRFNRLSNGFLCHHPEAEDVIGDIRYGMLPISTVPLWGIKTNALNSEFPAEFVKFRSLGEKDISQFYRMLFRRNVWAAE